MMIALPNLDGSFTVTLFLPHTTFATLCTPEDVLAFFEKNFSDSLPLLGREHLLKEFFVNPTCPLTSIKCSPYHAHKAVIFGDAAHAMVPFYGQGMNCGFEDCFVFHQLLDKHHGDFAKTLVEFSQERPKDAQAMCDLALYNFVEMRDRVNSSWFRFRKQVDSVLNKIAPNTYIPLYSMVTFSRIPYATVVARFKAQEEMINKSLKASLAVVVGGAAYAAVKFGPRALTAAKAAFASKLA